MGILFRTNRQLGFDKYFGSSIKFSLINGEHPSRKGQRSGRFLIKSPATTERENTYLSEATV